MTHSLLVELFVEELPPKALRQLGSAFGQVLHTQLVAQGLATAGASVLTPFASPRRLAAHITNIQRQADDAAQSQKLMATSAAFDSEGAPSAALRKKVERFENPRLTEQLNKWPDVGDGPDRLFVEGEGKSQALWFSSMVAGMTLSAGLQRALADAIAKLPIPKVMSYQLASNCELPGWTSVSFVRPAHGLVALHGADVVSVTALGLAAGRNTHGHRFEAAIDPVVLHGADSYAAQLEKDGAVIAGFDARRAELVRQLGAAAERVGGGAQVTEDDALLDEVTALVERPNVLVCQFEPEFLAVPPECLILTMKANQKYFPLVDADGKLTNRFLVVSNIRPDDASQVIGGNERVVRPRLADAQFFYEQDKKKTLASRVERLGKVVYHNKLGTQGERALRVEAIARAIAAQLGDDALVQQAAQAAQLAKTDLVTDMVGEFPELQGTMGRYYALHDGLDASVADAIEDHYKPRFAGDDLPRGQVGTVVALADKLETLVGMFGIGNLPTGDRDPFALRRHALGVVRMLSEKDLALDLDALLAEAAAAFDGVAGFEVARIGNELRSFIDERLAGSLREQGASAQEVDAVLAARPPRLGDVARRIAAVQAFAALPEAPALAAANKRIGNILKKSGGPVGAVDVTLFKEPEEASLHETMQEVLPQADAQFDAGDHAASLKTLAALRGPVDEFFDGVMVNAEEPELRRNRLALLGELHRAMNRVAQLERLAA